MRRIGRCAELGYMAVYTAIINYPFIPAMGKISMCHQRTLLSDCAFAAQSDQIFSVG